MTAVVQHWDVGWGVNQSRPGYGALLALINLKWCMAILVQLQVHEVHERKTNSDSIFQKVMSRVKSAWMDRAPCKLTALDQDNQETVSKVFFFSIRESIQWKHASSSRTTASLHHTCTEKAPHMYMGHYSIQCSTNSCHCFQDWYELM